MPTVLLTLALLPMLAATLAAEPAIRLRARIGDERSGGRQQVGFAPASVRVDLIIRPHPDNRAVVVLAWADGDETWTARSGRDLDGDRAPLAHHPIVWRDLPAGDYVVIAELWTADRIRASARDRIILRGREP